MLAQAAEGARRARTCACGEPMERVLVDQVMRWGKDGVYVRVTEVPAFECTECGETLFEDQVVGDVQALVRAGVDGADRIEQLPVKVYRSRARRP